MNYDCNCKGKAKCDVPVLNQKLLDTNMMTYNPNELYMWPHWEYSEEMMAEIKRREKFSSKDIKKDM
jgi:hypothetical protein